MIANRAASIAFRQSRRVVATNSGAAVAAASSTPRAEQQHRSSSVAAAAGDAPPPSASSTKKPNNVYMWGTSKKGTIPLNLLNDVVGAPESGGMFSKDDKVIDHPVGLNLNDSALIDFLFEGESSGDVGDGVYLEKVFCGASGTALVLNDGRCFVTGSNKNGELGIGSDRKDTGAKPIHLPLPDPVAKASLGQNFSAILTTTGDLYTFGYGGSRINGMGCLGHGSMDAHPTPTIVQSLIEDGCYASDVHCGEYSTTVLTTEGEVLTCGSGSYGRLGNLETTDQLYLEPVELMGAEDITQIAGGFAFSLALNSGGIIHAWGRNNEGQLGTGMGLAADMYAMESLPRPVEGNLEGRTVTRIAAGHAHAAAVTSAGELFTWGMNYTHEPRLETSLLHTRIVDVACGKNYTLALDEGGRVYSMGKGKTGVLGLASTKVTNQPVLIEGIPEGERVVSMTCGWEHVACMTESK